MHRHDHGDVKSLIKKNLAENNQFEQYRFQLYPVFPNSIYTPRAVQEYITVAKLHQN